VYSVDWLDLQATTYLSHGTYLRKTVSKNSVNQCVSSVAKVMEQALFKNFDRRTV